MSMQLEPLGFIPERHVMHWYDPTEFLHALLLPQGLALHSSISSHEWPFPVNPTLQLHEYDPFVLTHNALLSHSFSTEHSSISSHVNPPIRFLHSNPDLQL